MGQTTKKLTEIKHSTSRGSLDTVSIIYKTTQNSNKTMSGNVHGGAEGGDLTSHKVLSTRVELALKAR